MSGLRLARLRLVCADPDRLARFYEQALGFSRGEEADGGTRVSLGGLPVDLLGGAARPCPAEVPGWSPLFQHVAVVVSDMAAAYAHLRAVPGWTPISQAGPEHLPERSGGVGAFKFRDPEGHPLELLAFPAGRAPAAWRRPGLHLGIDHSAISVADSARSVAFYDRLGLRVTARALNRGPEQARLDAVADPQVEVTALEPASGGPPHVELLCYRGRFDRAGPGSSLDDGAATRLVFAAEAPETVAALRASLAVSLARDAPDRLLLRDPDGHWIEIEGPPAD
ncbi:MAG: VOC family protein [Methylobacterium frigidaeris]